MPLTEAEKRSPENPGYAKPRSGVDKKQLHEEMIDRHKACVDYWGPQYKDAQQDMEFAFMPDSQWDDWMVNTRKGRPMYTVNKLRQAMKQITNDQRQNRPQAKVRAVEDGDGELAEVRQGLLRNIDSTSEADRARDTAFMFAVGGGYGVWRINTRYEEDGGFDQVIEKQEVANPYSVTFDPAAKSKDRRDARYAFVDEKFSRAAFRDRWPDAKLVTIDGLPEGQRDWWEDDQVTVAEYWYKEVDQVEIVLMSDGSVYDRDNVAPILDELAAEGITEQKSRYQDRTTVYQCIVSGAEILEGPNEWAGRFIPLVPVWGEIINIKGKDQFFGAVRFAKDAQRIYNYERSATIEFIAEQPYSPFMADAISIQGYEAQYQSMRTKRPPVLLYNANPNAPGGGKPSREAPPSFPAAMANAAQISSDDIKSATGIYDASLGARSNETSGKAIIARQREGDVANFDYIDNLSYAIKYDFEITSDLISKIYDTERQVRIIGEDGAEKVIKVNKAELDQQTGAWIIPYDMSRGRFDIAVTVGPSYTTQRMEAAEAMMQLANDPSPIGMVAKYGFIKSLDAPGLEEVRKAARKILVGQGLLEPEEGEQPPQPQQPNPKDVADAQKSAEQAKLYGAQAQGQQLDNVILEQQVQAQHLLMQMPPPVPPQLQPSPTQPPQGGFFMPGAQNQPQDGTAPGGIPGQFA